MNLHFNKLPSTFNIKIAMQTRSEWFENIDQNRFVSGKFQQIIGLQAINNKFPIH